MSRNQFLDMSFEKAILAYHLTLEVCILNLDISIET